MRLIDADPQVPLFGAIFHGLFTDLDDPVHVMAGYERHLALDVPAPMQPFPHRNSTADYLVRAQERARESMSAAESSQA